MSQRPIFSESKAIQYQLSQWLSPFLVIVPLVIMGLLTKAVLIPALKDPEAAYYSSSKGYPAQQRAAGRPIKVEVVTISAEQFEDSLAAPGEVIAQAHVELRPVMAGVVQGVYVEEGERVEKDQVLMRLSPDELEHEVEIARLNLETAKANLLAVQSSGAASLERLQSNVEISQAQLAGAEARFGSLAKLVTDQQTIDLNALQVQLNNAQIRLNNLQTLVQEGALAQVQLQAAEDTVATLRRQFLTAQQGSLSSHSTLHDARSDIVFYRQKLQQDQQALTRAHELEAVRLSKAKLTRENRQMLLSEALRTLEQTVIRASTSGLLSTVHIDEGEFIDPNTPEPAMVLSQDMVFQAYVDQVRLNEVQVGDLASVRLVAHSGQTFEGQVIRVNPAIETADGVPGRVGVDRQYTYSVWINVADLEMPPGLQGYVHFSKTQTHVSIPESAVVHLSGGEGMAMVVEDGRAALRSLKLGPLQNNKRNVMSGLLPGEQVILYPNGLKPGDQIQPTVTIQSQLQKSAIWEFEG